MSRLARLCRAVSLAAFQLQGARLVPNQRMQLTGRCEARPPMHVRFGAAAVEALVCEPRVSTARS
jgi:hypothetical protein